MFFHTLCFTGSMAKGNNRSMITLSKRLATVASLVPPCEIAADVGTDHAYLASWLLQSGVTQHMFATDINAGPLARAKQTALEQNLSQQMEFYLCDGLRFPGAETVQTVVIAGMGGETMISILQAAPWSWTDTQLILQPQSKQQDLFDWLREHQIGIEAAKLCEDAGKLYLALRASGRADPERNVVSLLYDAHDLLLPSYLEQELGKLNRAIAGMDRAARNMESERTALQNQIAVLEPYRKAVETW